MKKRILLVDDESSIRRSLSVSLGQRGFETDPCEDGVSALKKLEALVKSDQSPSAIVLDIKLPDIEGTQLAKIIKFKYPGIPVILITGYADKINPQEIRDLKVMAFLEKPFSVDQLAELFSQTAEQAETQPAPEPDKSLSTYMLVKMDREDRFFETYRKLYYEKNVLYCDAVKGEYDLILLVQGKSYGECQEFKKQVEGMDGIGSVDYLSVEDPVFDEDIAGIIDTGEDALFNNDQNLEKQRDLSNRVCSYIALEIEKEKLENIYTALRFNENVVSCDYTTGGRYDLMLLVHGSYFGEIHKMIQERIAPMNGILKVKEFPVINIFEM